MSDAEAVVKKYSLRERRIGLRKFRKQAGLSLEEVAGLAGLSQSMVSKFELGHRDLSPEAYGRLERAIVKALGHQKALARRKQETERRAVAKTEHLAGRFVTLKSLAQPSFEEYQEICNQMAAQYGPKWREVFKEIRDLEREKADLEKRVAELRDLLAVETQKALSETEAIELRARIAKRETIPPRDED